MDTGNQKWGFTHLDALKTQQKSVGIAFRFSNFEQIKQQDQSPDDTLPHESISLRIH